MTESNKLDKKNLNIFNVIKERGISYASISRKSGIKYQALRDKLTRRTEFKFIESRQVYNTFFTEYDIDWLFKEED